MIEEERIRKKKEEKEKGFWETFISSLLEKCAAAAIQVAFDNIFGQNRKYGDYDELEQSIIDQLADFAEEDIESALSEMVVDIE